jgi:hypothetical protein
MIVHFKCLEAILFFKNSLKNPFQIVAFSLNVVYNYLYSLDVGSPRICGLSKIPLFVRWVLSKSRKVFFKKKSLLRVFLGMNLGCLAYLNISLLFQHRNKMGFLCVT